MEGQQLISDIDDRAGAPIAKKRGRPRKYHFDDLKPGECLTIEGKRLTDVATSIALARKRTGFPLFAYQDCAGGLRVCRPSMDHEHHHRVLAEKREQRSRERKNWRRTETGH